MEEETKFIINTLQNENDNFCGINKINYSKKKENIYIQKIRNLISTNILYGPDMKNILCMFNNLILSCSNIKDNFGLRKPSGEIMKWVQSIEKININSTQGWLYFMSVFNLQIIMKTPQDEVMIYDALREYLIGIGAINLLRYKTPVFLYTFGAFSCPFPNKDGSIKTLCEKNNSNTIYILNEKIDGKTMADYLKNNIIDFDNWLLIFMQLLLSLELSQREREFTHFDLHTSNVMIISNKVISYEINLDNNTYYLENIRNQPVIIDFGYSTAKINDTTIGSFDFPEYGMLNFMVPGYDMFKFLCTCCNECSNVKMQNSILKIFSFYGNDDPYNIYERKILGVRKALDKYCQLGSYSKLGTYTPLMMFEWLYKSYGQKFIIKKPRSNFIKLHYYSFIKEYNEIFTEKIDNQVKEIMKCLKNNTSYIIEIYNIQILEKINIHLNSDIINTKINSSKNILKIKKISEKMIKLDKTKLEKVFNIKMPDQDLIDISTKNILDISIRHNIHYDKIYYEKKISEIMLYENELDPYLQLYYTILELNLISVYKEWLYKFENSLIWKFYFKNVNKIQRSKRWSITLINSIK